MTNFGGYELREIHDWNNPLRSYIDALEMVVLVLMTVFGLFYGLGGAGTWHDHEGFHSAPIWKLFTSWRAFSHLAVGTCLFSAGMFLLRDWMYGIEERKEERWRRKLWNEECNRLAPSHSESQELS
jgi:hypothetical protein